jgi:hypothetical protein
MARGNVMPAYVKSAAREGYSGPALMVAAGKMYQKDKRAGKLKQKVSKPKKSRKLTKKSKAKRSKAKKSKSRR